MLERLAVGYAATFALSAARVGGFVAISPLPGEHAPLQARLGLVLVLSMVVTPLVIAPGAAPELGLALLVPAVTELCVGLLIGLVFRFVLGAADVLGGVLSQAVGLGMPSLFNPAAGAQDTAVGEIMGLFAMILALGVGAHRVVLAYVLESFRAVPVGSAVHVASSAPLFFELAGRAVAVGAHLAMPVVATAVAIQLVLALVARAAPSMQIFSIGFTVLLLVGFGTLMASMPAIAAGLVDHLALMSSALDRLLSGFVLSR
jgi:flagellar biosynthetic protein FliR